MNNNLKRRGLLKGAAALTAGGFAVPNISIGQGGDEKLNVACIGIGNKGSDAVQMSKQENLVALCDVDWRADKALYRKRSPAASFEANPQAEKFKDYREMLDVMGDKIDVVCVATPDHSHFAATLAAMEKGKHVFVQKPLTHNIWQLRTLQKAAHKYGVQTVMGNQGHTSEAIRLIVEWVQAGILGEVREVHCWTDRPRKPWFIKPTAIPPATGPVPEGLDWDLWQGPVPERDYSAEYVPKLWRGWWDYGVGALGDIGCHTLDAPFWALNLGMPTAVDIELDEPVNMDYTVNGAHVTYHFAARGDLPPVKVHWYEGARRPPVLPGMAKLPKGGGMYMVGSEETLYAPGIRPESPQLWPRENMMKYKDILKLRPLPRVNMDPVHELFRAVKGGPKPGSNFDYAAPLTEMVLLGGLAIRTGKRIEWDAKQMKITNHPELNAFVKEPVRKGWEYGEDLWKA
ncbi:Gfo/Idh/MocA family protein [Pontiella agarivorans]|uniref:Gfo/Idh/MocA family oxidoreductase n=1 Tax=Pontiella agarivorans TaxID=3038953 RepID=A0ABU5MUD6_9BACT|nr:Gfo/Idh/MocA family oxidoreductase [Pontiella agarivorans]MDZ8117830.1 Gfo/Idh/MocA family oxidoreductase [Pontiella agarivorans]